MNITISKDYKITIDMSTEPVEYQVTKEVVSKLVEILKDKDSIPTYEWSNADEQIAIRHKFDKKWIKDRHIKMSEEEQNAYTLKYVASTDDYNIYISRRSFDGIYFLEFTGVTSTRYSIFDLDNLRNDVVVTKLFISLLEEVL